MDDTNSLSNSAATSSKSFAKKALTRSKINSRPRNPATPRGKITPKDREVSVAGRITAHREMGKSMFIDVRDQSGRIQIYAQKNMLEEVTFSRIWIWAICRRSRHSVTTKSANFHQAATAARHLFRDRKQIETGRMPVPYRIGAIAFTILAKALRPPPAKWHGLEDTEIRYRQRYLDLIANPDVKKIFLQRSEIVHEIRQFFHARGYVEVETPAMQAIPGGAAAQPFKTFHNALGCEFYLRIALELYHKRLLVGGIDKLFEIGKNFRNEGLSRRHNPEFTMLEAYCAFGDYATMMETVESLITTVAQKVLGTLKIRTKHESRINCFIRSIANLFSAAFQMENQNSFCECKSIVNRN